MCRIHAGFADEGTGMAVLAALMQVSPDVFIFKKATAEKPIQVQVGRQEVRLVVQNGTLATTEGKNLVLVTPQTPPSLVRYLDRLVGVFCEQGATTGHFVTVCREFGIVLLVGAEGAMDQLSTGKEAALDGFDGRVFSVRNEALAAGQPQIIQKNAAYRKRIRRLLDYITPLRLTDPESPYFKANSARRSMTLSATAMKRLSAPCLA